MVDKPNIVHLELIRYTTEDWSLSLPILNLDGSPYDLTGAKAKCTMKKIAGPAEGTLLEYIFSTILGNITISTNTLILTADHSLLEAMIGMYEGEVLLNVPTDIDLVVYALRCTSTLAETANNSW